MQDAEETEIGNNAIVASLALQALIMTAVGVALWWATGRAVGDFISFSSREVAIGLAIGAAFMATSLAISWIAPQFRRSLIAEQAENAPGSRKPFTPIQAVLISIFAGIGEEALFRGGILITLAGYLHPYAAIAISAALFAFLHLQSRRIILIIFIAGCLYGLAFHISGSLLAVMVGHAVYDIWAMLRSQREMAHQGFYDEKVQDS